MREKKRKKGGISLKEKYKEAVKVGNIDIKQLMEEFGLSEKEAKAWAKRLEEEEWVPDLTRSEVISLAHELTEEVWDDERLHKVIDEMKYFSGQLHPYKLLKFACFLVMLDHIPWDKKHELLLEYAIAINSPRTVLRSSQDYVRVNLLIPRSHYVFFKDLLKELKKASRWKGFVSLSGLISDSLQYLVLNPRDLIKILRVYPDKYVPFLFSEDLEEILDEIEKRIAQVFMEHMRKAVERFERAEALRREKKRKEEKREEKEDSESS